MKSFKEYLIEAETSFEIVDSFKWDDEDDHFKKWLHQEPDEFFYHVTSLKSAQKILTNGLSPNQRATVSGWYQEYSKGKIFFSERDGVANWISVIADHLHASYDNPPDMAVIRFPKDLVKDPKKDEEGSKDTRHDSYYTTETIVSRKK